MIYFYIKKFSFYTFSLTGISRQENQGCLVYFKPIQTIFSPSSQYNIDLTTSTALGYHYPNGNLFHLDLEKSNLAETLEFQQLQQLLNVPIFEDSRFRQIFENAHQNFLLGGLLESEDQNDIGRTFSKIIFDQFLRLRQV